MLKLLILASCYTYFLILLHHLTQPRARFNFLFIHIFDKFDEPVEILQFLTIRKHTGHTEHAGHTKL